MIQQILESHELNDHVHVHIILSILESQDQTGHTNCDHDHPDIFWSAFNICECLSRCKKSGYFTDLFWRYGWLKNPAIWLAENILAHTQEQKFCQKWDLCRNIANNTNFHLEQIHYKLMTQFLNKFLKNCFWLIFGPFSQFWGQIPPPENMALSRTLHMGL